MNRVLIGGGRGFIGSHLMRLLEGAGYNVTCISRKPAPQTMTWADLDTQGLPEDCVAVVNLAGENVMNISRRWTEEFKSDLRSSRIYTTDRLATAVARAKNPPKVFVGASAVGIYKPDALAEYDEDTIGENYGFMSELVRDWEAASVLPKNVPTRRVTVRIGLALGRDGGAIKSMIPPFWFGLGGRIASGQQWFPWVHVDDVAGIMHHAIKNDHVHGVLNAVAPQTNTNAEFTTAFGKALWRPTLFPMPGFVLNMVLGAERAELMVSGQKVIPKRTLESGYDFLYPNLDSACREFAHLAIN